MAPSHFALCDKDTAKASAKCERTFWSDEMLGMLGDPHRFRLPFFDPVGIITQNSGSGNILKPIRCPALVVTSLLPPPLPLLFFLLFLIFVLLLFLLAAVVGSSMLDVSNPPLLAPPKRPWSCHPPKAPSPATPWATPEAAFRGPQRRQRRHRPSVNGQVRISSGFHGKISLI